MNHIVFIGAEQYCVSFKWTEVLTCTVSDLTVANEEALVK